MGRKLQTKVGKADYARRKAIVEPVFGQIKVAQSAHQLRVRGQVKADIEWTFHLACHNFRKLAGSGWTTPSWPPAEGNGATPWGHPWDLGRACTVADLD